MRLDFKLFYIIIAVALVGGLFSVVSAQSVATITFDGNMHATDDADVDGDLNIDGVITGPSFADLEARVAALEAGGQ